MRSSRAVLVRRMASFTREFAAFCVICTVMGCLQSVKAAPVGSTGRAEQARASQTHVPAAPSLRGRLRSGPTDRQSDATVSSQTVFDRSKGQTHNSQSGEDSAKDTARDMAPTSRTSLSLQRDQDVALDALTSGSVQSLPAVLAMLRREVPGEVLSVKLKRGARDLWLYSFLILDKSGMYRDVLVDAVVNRVIEIRLR